LVGKLDGQKLTVYLYQIGGVRPQGQRDARGVREQVALQAAADDFPRDQVGGPSHLSGVPRHLGDHQHLLVDHRHFAQVPHFRRVRRVVSLRVQETKIKKKKEFGFSIENIMNLLSEQNEKLMCLPIKISKPKGNG